MSQFRSVSFSTGLAIFSMFFGAGNIVFPLVLGQIVKGDIIVAFFGLLLTAVLIPFLGLLAITLFKGNYEIFFNRIGKTPGFIVIVLLLAILGPFGGIPRCITLTYSTLQVYFPKMELLTFSIFGCMIIYFCSWKKTRIVDLIGYILSPILLVFLCIIIIKGTFFSPYTPLSPSSINNPFFYGLREGYNTMDLIAAFFFSTLVYQRLKEQVIRDHDHKTLLAPILKSGMIGFSLLGLIYGGFSYIAARQSLSLQGTSIEHLLGKIGSVVLGQQGGFVVSICIALTCLTTAIALTVVSAEFLQKRFSKKNISYEWSIAFILVGSLGVSSLDFKGIMQFLSPILQSIYPALLILCFCNIFYKLLHFKPIKIPFYLMLVIVIFFQYFT